MSRKKTVEAFPGCTFIQPLRTDATKSDKWET